jgi:hypothetical protein
MPVCIKLPGVKGFSYEELSGRAIVLLVLEIGQTIRLLDAKLTRLSTTLQGQKLRETKYENKYKC